MGRATLVGQITGGGAHYFEFHTVEHCNIEINVFYAIAVNPMTGTKREHVSVEENAMIS